LIRFVRVRDPVGDAVTVHVADMVDDPPGAVDSRQDEFPDGRWIRGHDGAATREEPPEVHAGRQHGRRAELIDEEILRRLDMRARTIGAELKPHAVDTRCSLPAEARPPPAEDRGRQRRDETDVERDADPADAPRGAVTGMTTGAAVGVVERQLRPAWNPRGTGRKAREACAHTCRSVAGTARPAVVPTKGAAGAAVVRIVEDRSAAGRTSVTASGPGRAWDASPRVANLRVRAPMCTGAAVVRIVEDRSAAGRTSVTASGPCRAWDASPRVADLRVRAPMCTGAAVVRIVQEPGPAVPATVTAREPCRAREAGAFTADVRVRTGLRARATVVRIIEHGDAHPTGAATIGVGGTGTLDAGSSDASVEEIALVTTGAAVRVVGLEVEAGASAERLAGRTWAAPPGVADLLGPADPSAQPAVLTVGAEVLAASGTTRGVALRTVDAVAVIGASLTRRADAAACAAIFLGPKVCPTASRCVGIAGGPADGAGVAGAADAPVHATVDSAAPTVANITREVDRAGECRVTRGMALGEARNSAAAVDADGIEVAAG